MDNFKEMVLLYEDLVRKETIAYKKANPNLVNSYEQISDFHGKPYAEKTIQIIYGTEIANEFLKEYKKREIDLCPKRQSSRN